MDGSQRWPDEFVWKEHVPPPERWGKPGVLLFFNIECAGCVSRAVPFLKELHRDFGDSAEILAVHTSFGHRNYEREQLLPALERFAGDFARLPFPVALDIDGHLAHAWRAEGTPHWLVFEPGGELARSIFGSQENARTRLRYLLEELTAGDRTD